MKFLSGLFARANAAGAAAPREIDAATAREWHQRGECLLIDVREDAEHRAMRIPGARLAPLSRLEQAVPPLPEGKKVVFLCQSGARTRMHARRLAKCAGVEAHVMSGGIGAWRASGFPIERG